MSFELDESFMKVVAQEIRLLKKKPDVLKRKTKSSKLGVFFFEKDMQTAFLSAIRKVGSVPFDEVEGKGFGLNLYLSERKNSRIDILVKSEGHAIELKVVSIPCLSNQGDLYNIGQISSDLYRYEYAKGGKNKKIKKITSAVMVTGPTIIGMKDKWVFNRNDVRKFVHNSFFSDYCSSSQLFPSDEKKKKDKVRVKMRGVQKKYLEKLGFGEEYYYSKSQLECYWSPKDSFALVWITRDC